MLSLNSLNFFKFFKNIMNIVIFSLILGNIQIGAAESEDYDIRGFVPDVEVFSEGIYMVNLETGAVILSKNQDARFYPASTVKVMTALITLENVEDLDALVEIPGVVMNEFDPDNPNKFGASAADIRTGQTNVSYRDCLYALMLASACEAGNILAYNVGGGSMSRFIEMMNEKADELGCLNSRFANSHGLHEEGNYSSVYDMYLVTKYAYDKYPIFMEISNSYEYEMPANSANPDGYSIFSTNRLITPASDFNYEHARGIKTGSIDLYHNLITGEVTDGHASFISSATRNGYTYLLVTMGAPFYDVSGTRARGNYHFKDHIALYKWAFDSFEYKNVLTKNDVVAVLPVLQGENADTIQLKPLDDYFTLLPVELDQSAIQRRVITDSQTVTAPIEKGQILGTVELRFADETLASIQLIAADTVELSRIARVTDEIKGVLDNPWVRFGLIGAAVLIVIIAAATAVSKSKKKKKPANRRIKR